MSVQYVRQALSVAGWGRWAQVRYRDGQVQWDGGLVLANRLLVRRCETCPAWVSLPRCPNGHSQTLSLFASVDTDIGRDALEAWFDFAGQSPLAATIAASEVKDFSRALIPDLKKNADDRRVYVHDF